MASYLLVGILSILVYEFVFCLDDMVLPDNPDNPSSPDPAFLPDDIDVHIPKIKKYWSCGRYEFPHKKCIRGRTSVKMHKAVGKMGEQLLEDLLFDYNKNVRPIQNASDVLVVEFASSLIRIIDLNEKTQELTTNLWLDLQWTDVKLIWDPLAYDNISKLNIPADMIWKPDIVLYNNADGDPHITIKTDTFVYYDGTVAWKPPAIYRSFCPINVGLFPYDVQNCTMKFGDWSYDGSKVDLKQKPPGIIIGTNKDGFNILYLEKGMDLSYFKLSAEWELLDISSKKQEIFYKTCCGNATYPDITFTFVLRRKGLFPTAFLVVPSILIALLTTLVFYLPSCSMKKMTLATNILVALMVFFTALEDLVPPNSVVAPLLMKYLLFTMLLVALSIAVNVFVLNLHYRDSGTHEMPAWVRSILLKRLPRFLGMKVPEWHRIDPMIWEVKEKIRNSVCSYIGSRGSNASFETNLMGDGESISLSEMAKQRGMHPEVIRRMMDNINSMADMFSQMEDDKRISADWSYVALVMDRVFLWIFTVSIIAGTILLFYQTLLIDNRDHIAIPADAKNPLGGDTYFWQLNNTGFNPSDYSYEQGVGPLL